MSTLCILPEKRGIRMLKKIIFTGVFTILLLLFGMSEKNKYTDITRNNDWMQGAEVASNGNIADKCIIMKEILPQSPIICKVKVLDDIEIITEGGKQKAIIEEVYKGEISEGEEVYLYSTDWYLTLPVESSKQKVPFFNIRKTNIPCVGNEYLVFASETIQEKKGTLLVLFPSENISVTPIFCYEDSINVVVMPDGHDGTAIPYETVKNNEFILPSEEDLRYMEETKKYLLEYFIYGSDRECY